MTGKQLGNVHRAVFQMGPVRPRPDLMHTGLGLALTCERTGYELIAGCVLPLATMAWSRPSWRFLPIRRPSTCQSVIFNPGLPHARVILQTHYGIVLARPNIGKPVKET